MKPAIISTLFAIGCSLAYCQSDLLVDRGLPQKNLNNDSGAESRSNVRWSWYQDGFVGDDLSIGQPGERWVIDSIKVWTVPGGQGTGDPDYLGDLFRDVRLYFGTEQEGVSPVSVGILRRGTNESTNGKISIREARAGDGYAIYEDFGTNVRVWEIEFSGLGIEAAGGTPYLFGTYGLGRAVPGEKGKVYAWYNYASNANLGGVAAQGSDDQLHLFKASGQSDSSFVSDGKGWNKNCDINIQVYGHKISE